MGLSYSGGLTVVSGGFNTRTNTPPAWATTAGSLGSATAGVPFNYNLSATDADEEPVSFRLSTGALPPGLTLNNSGTISGTPVNMANTYNFSVIASDGTADVSRDFSITVTNTTPAWSTAGGALTNAVGNVAYDITVVANDANYDTVTYSLVSGTLPTGITLNGTTGQLSGTPTNAPATYNFTLRADDGHGATADRAFSIQVTNTTPVWQSPATSLPGPYTQYSAISTITLVATDENGDSVSYAVYASTLPTGLTLNGAQITGTPTVSGAFGFTIRATDFLGATADRTFSMTIAAAGDIYWNNTVLSMHMDGTNGSTTFVDSTGRQANPTATSTTISTTSPKYGTGHGSFTRGSSKLVFSDSTDFDLGVSGASFTIEGWFKASSVAAGTYDIINRLGTTYDWSATSGLMYTVRLDTNVGSELAINYNIGGGNASSAKTSGAAISAGTYYHFAIVNNQSANTFDIFINGVSKYSSSAITITKPSSATNFCVGMSAPANSGNSFGGNLDDIRITKGIARYTSNFTPPTEAYINGPAWSTASGALPAGTKNVAYSTTITATGTSVTYAVQSGTLPTGLALSGNTILGTPTASNNYTFTIRATDASGSFSDRTFSINIPVVYNAAVPTLTSSVTGGTSTQYVNPPTTTWVGVVSAGSPELAGAYSAGGAYPFQAFDGNTDNLHQHQCTSYPMAAGYAFGSLTTVTRYTVTSSGGNGSSYPGRAPYNWNFQGWNGSSWVTIDTQSAITSWYSGSTPNTKTFDIAPGSQGAYYAYRLYITRNANNDSSYTCYGEMQFYTS